MSAGMAKRDGTPKLIWLFFMHRHGDRSPLNMGSKDKYNDLKYWPEGFGNLNNADSFREVYSRSSDVDRCIESSNAILAGMYPPSNKFMWNNELLWTPPSVHTCPVKDDYLLNEAGSNYVAKIQEELALVQKSDKVKQLYDQSVEERKILEKELGYVYDCFWKFNSTYSTLDIEERNGLEMPPWYTPEMKEKFYRLGASAFALTGGGTETLKQLRCGHLLEDIIQRMQLASATGPRRDEKSDQQPTNAPSVVVDRKVVHYSTHDTILAAFLEGLDINSPPVAPGFGATFFIELYVDVTEDGQPISEKYLKLFYLDDTESEQPIEQVLPNCELNEKGQLTLEAFKRYVQHLLPAQSV